MDGAKAMFDLGVGGIDQHKHIIVGPSTRGTSSQRAERNGNIKQAIVGCKIVIVGGKSFPAVINAHCGYAVE